MSMPSILTVPDCGSKTRCSSASAVDLPAPVAPTSATVSPGSAVKLMSRDRRPLAVVGEATRPRTRPALQPAGIDASGRSRTPGSVSRTSKNSASRGASMNIRLANLHACSSCAISMAGEAHEHHDAADRRLPVRVQQDAEDRGSRASSASSRRASTPRPAPTRTAPASARRAAGRPTSRSSRHLDFDAGEALHQRDIAERVGGALGEVRVVALDRALQSFGLREHERVQHDEDERKARSAGAPSRQLR